MNLDSLEAKEKTNQQNSRRIILITSAILFLILIGLLFLILFSPKEAYTKDKLNSDENLSLAGDKLMTLSPEEAKVFYPFTDEYSLLVNNDLISYLTYQGESEKTFQVHLTEPIVKVNDNYALISDYNAFNYYLFDKKGLVLEGATDSPIQSASLASNGYFAFILDSQDAKATVRLLDNNGKHIMDYKLRDKKKSGYPLSLSFNPQADKLFINVINTNTSKIKTHIHKIDLESLEINYKLDLVENELLPVTYANANNEICLLNNKNLYYTNLLDNIKKVSFTEIKNYAFSDEIIAVIARDTEAEDLALYYVNLDSKDTDSKVTGPISLGKEPYKLAANYNKIAVASDQGVYIVSTNGYGAEPSYYEIGAANIYKLKFINANELLLVCSDGLRLITI